MNKKFLFIFLIFAAIAFIIYFPGINALRYGDDFNIVPEGKLSSDLYKVWTTPYQREMFYRPIEDTIMTFIIYFFGWNTLPLHIIIILLHVIFITLIYYIMVKLKFSDSASLLAALFILIAQVNVFVVGSNDTLATMLTSLLNTSSLWFFYRANKDNQGNLNTKLYLLSILLFTISLFCKETSVTFFPQLFVLLLVINSFYRKQTFSRLKKSLLISLPFVIIFLIYFLIHSSIVIIQPTVGESNYSFQFNFTVVKNIIMMLFAIFLPVSSVRTFEAVQLRDYKFLAIAAGLTITLIIIIFYGIWKSKKLKEAVVVFCFIVAGFFPYALMNHVNEQYTYFSMPFVAILMAFGIGYFTDIQNQKLKSIFITFFLIILLINSFFVMEKSRQMTKTGEQAEMLFQQIKNYLPLVEHNGALIMVNPPDKGIRYSVFKLPGFETMRYAQFYIYKLAGRQDFRVDIIEWNEIEQHRKPNFLILKLDSNKVLPMD